MQLELTEEEIDLIAARPNAVHHDDISSLYYLGHYERKFASPMT